METCEYFTQYPLCSRCNTPTDTAHVCNNGRTSPRATPEEHRYMCIRHRRYSKHDVIANPTAPCLAVDPAEPTKEKEEHNLFQSFNSTPVVTHTNGTDYLRNMGRPEVSNGPGPGAGVGTTEIRAFVADPPPEENS